MGLDGGTIISRTDVIRGASWRLASRDSARSTRGGQLSAGDLLGGEERVGAREQREAAWSACALTGEALREPIVACQLGRLYNRESVLQLLLWRAGVVAEESDKWRFSRLQDHLHLFAHIRSKKDVVTVRFHTDSQPSQSSRAECTTGNGRSDSDKSNEANTAAAAAAAPSQPSPELTSGLASARTATGSGLCSSSTGGAHAAASGGGSGSSRDASHWVCPLSGSSASSGQPFSLLRPCGHAFTTRALAQLKESQCPVCGKEYGGSSDVTPINPTPDQVEHLQQQLKTRTRARRKGVPALDNVASQPRVDSPPNKKLCSRDNFGALSS